MEDLKSKISEKCDVSEKAVRDFYNFAMKNLFDRLPDNSCELIVAYTTFSYLHLRFIIKMPNQRGALLSFNLLGAKSFLEDRIFTDYLQADFAFVNAEMDKVLSGVRVFEGNLEKFKAIFYEKVIPLFNRF